MAPLIETLQASATEAINRTAAFAPRVFGALVILLLGWIAGRIVGRIVFSAVRRTSLDDLVHHSALGPLVADTEHGVARAFDIVSRWFIYGLTLLAAADILAITVLSRWLSAAVGYLPSFIGGLLIILIGFLVSDFVGDLIHRTELTTHVPYTNLIANGVRMLLYFIVTVIGLDTMGVNVSFLYLFAGAILAGLALATSIGVGLAFGLGGRDYVAENIDQWIYGEHRHDYGQEHDHGHE
jgi:small-conductance mechanosensitive channel